VQPRALPGSPAGPARATSDTGAGPASRLTCWARARRTRGAGPVQPSRLPGSPAGAFRGRGGRSETAQHSGRAPTTAGANSRARGSSRELLSRRRAALCSGPSRALARMVHPMAGTGSAKRREGWRSKRREEWHAGANPKGFRSQRAAADRGSLAGAVERPRTQGERWASGVRAVAPLASADGSEKWRAEWHEARRKRARETARGTAQNGRTKRREARRKRAPARRPKNFGWAPGSSAGANFFPRAVRAGRDSRRRCAPVGARKDTDAAR